MRHPLALLLLSLGACATKELPVAAGHPADPNAPAANAPPSLDVLGSAFTPDALIPQASGAPDPHGQSGGHAH